MKKEYWYEKHLVIKRTKSRFTCKIAVPLFCVLTRIIKAALKPHFSTWSSKAKNGKWSGCISYPLSCIRSEYLVAAVSNFPLCLCIFVLLPYLFIYLNRTNRPSNETMCFYVPTEYCTKYDGKMAFRQKLIGIL